MNKNTNNNRKKFLPINQSDMKARNWDVLDFLIISGDAYVDHPSFGSALIGRVLLDAGYRVGIIAQPDWKDETAFLAMGKPELAVLLASGNLDSMVAHYTVNKKPRKTDLYSPSGKTGKRPDRALIVYSSMVKKLFKNVPIIIGGLEASLRRFAHYDYWQDKVRRSILFDTKADLLLYGMAEKSLLQIAKRLFENPASELTEIPGTCVNLPLDYPVEGVQIPSFEQVSSNHKAFNQAFKLQYEQQDPRWGKSLIQQHGNRNLVQYPPAPPLSVAEMDHFYQLPFTRAEHPDYQKLGEIPALTEVSFSITAVRGCFGSCSFCSLHFHQGRIIQHRSDQSLLDEATLLTKEPEFKGYIHDVGGPTGNMVRPSCDKQFEKGSCSHRQCLFPTPCPKLQPQQTQLLQLLQKMRKIKGIKKIFLRSGLRYDLIQLEKKDTFLRELVEHHVSGQLRVAPEHNQHSVLNIMGKPDIDTYLQFKKQFELHCKRCNKNQYIVPYFISSHPGSTLQDAVKLAEFLRDIKSSPEQVQDFYPTPGTLSTAIYHTGFHPLTGKKVYVPKDHQEKSLQRALLQFREAKNHSLVRKALQMTGRTELIGNGPKCLVPEAGARPFRYNQKK